jgi:hypothetical protein
MKLSGKRCQCGDGGRNGGCGEYFTRLSAFDRHRVGNRDVPGRGRWCLSAFAMEAIGMFAAPKGDERLWYGSRGAILGAPEAQISRLQAGVVYG